LLNFTWVAKPAVVQVPWAFVLVVPMKLGTMHGAGVGVGTGVGAGP